MATTSHILEGQWRRPDAQQHRFDELELWTDLARRLEAARFDAVFFADVVGLYGNYRGDWDIFATEGLQIPSHDPSVMLSALAAATEHLGLAWTSSVIQEHLFNFARRAATLDHLTRGRVGWNIVTSALENSHRNFGLPGLTPHDERHRWADEYVDVVYKLLEGSWDDGALLRDKTAGVHADPDGIHKIHHSGPRYQVDGPHLAAPSPSGRRCCSRRGTRRRAWSSPRATPRRCSCSPVPRTARGRWPRRCARWRPASGVWRTTCCCSPGCRSSWAAPKPRPGGARTRPTPPCRWKGWPGTFREKLFDGSGPRVNTRHPATHHRGAFRNASK